MSRLSNPENLPLIAKIETGQQFLVRSLRGNGDFIRNAICVDRDGEGSVVFVVRDGGNALVPSCYSVGSFAPRSDTGADNDYQFITTDHPLVVAQRKAERLEALRNKVSAKLRECLDHALLTRAADALDGKVVTLTPDGVYQTPRRTAGAIIRDSLAGDIPKNLLIVVVDGDGYHKQRYLDNPNGNGLASTYESDRFVRWATKEECEAHKIPYVARDGGSTGDGGR